MHIQVNNSVYTNTKQSLPSKQMLVSFIYSILLVVLRSGLILRLSGVLLLNEKNAYPNG